MYFYEGFYDNTNDASRLTQVITKREKIPVSTAKAIFINLEIIQIQKHEY